MNRPLCFVLMPFGRKRDASGATIDFDSVYRDFIEPAVRAAEMEPVRADEEQAGGIIHKQMFERLILCEYAVADLTTANANVFYELGIRHAVREWSTVLVFAEGRGQLPFDVGMLRAVPYRMGTEGVADLAVAREALTTHLREAKKAKRDSPVFTLIEGFPDVDHAKTDVFRERVQYSETMKAKLARARNDGPEAVRVVEAELGNIGDSEAGVIIDLYLSYRAVKAWDDMIALFNRMSPPLAATVMVREQLGFALNRAGRSEEAESVLLKVIEERGPSSETYGLLGRVYKDRWEGAVKTGSPALAKGMLNRAIEAYLKGFEADWRDAFPGVNAVTLMELREPPDPRRSELLPVVSYAVERKIASGKPDYWDFATRLELAVLAGDEARAEQALSDALANVRETWEPETTARNLRLIREAREGRGERVDWLKKIENELNPPGKPKR